MYERVHVCACACVFVCVWCNLKAEWLLRKTYTTGQITEGPLDVYMHVYVCTDECVVVCVLACTFVCIWCNMYSF